MQSLVGSFQLSQGGRAQSEHRTTAPSLKPMKALAAAGKRGGNGHDASPDARKLIPLTESDDARVLGNF